MEAFSDRDAGLAIWLLLGLLIAAVIALAIFEYLGALLFAVFLYYATRPLYRRLNEYIDHPDLTVTLTLLAVVLPLLLVVSYAVVMAFQELEQFLAMHDLGQYRTYLQPYLSLVREGRLRQLWDTLVTNPNKPLNPAARRVLGRVRTVLGLAITILSYLFLMSVFLFYLLRDDHKLSSWSTGASTSTSGSRSSARRSTTTSRRSSSAT